MKKNFNLSLLIVPLLFYFLAGTDPVSAANKRLVKRHIKVKITKLMIRPIDKKAPGFLYKPDIFPQYVTSSNHLPVMTFSANEDVNLKVEPRDGSGQNRLAGEILADTTIKKGMKIEVAWKIATVPNGDYNFHITMIEKAGNRTDYNAPFTVDIINNPNSSMILY
jgi:hypothetical protein